jgi:predicted alpha/beta hydrolase family esterase
MPPPLLIDFFHCLNCLFVGQIWSGKTISPNFFPLAFPSTRKCRLLLMLSNFYFILPGLYNSGPMHWQTRWERLYGFTRIHQRNWDTPVKDDWIHTLNEVTAPFPPERVILIAHSLGCCTIVHWYQRYRRVIKGALLVAPSDVEAPSYPTGTSGFTPMPLPRLPFSSIVVASSNDEYVSPTRAAWFADNWGSSLADIGKKGHINSDSGLGDWPQGYQLLQKLTS